MRYKQIATRIWQDDWFISLSQEAKTLFLYLLTNQYNNLIGIYELSIRTISFETGMSVQKIEKLKNELKNKVIFYKNWIKITNSSKYSNYSGTKLQNAIDKQLNDVPEEIIYSMDRVSMEYPYPMDTTTNTNTNNINTTNIVNNTTKAKEFSKVEDLTVDTCIEVAAMYSLREKDVLEIMENLKLYCAQHPNKYKDYKAALQTWCRRDLADGKIERKMTEDEWYLKHEGVTLL